MNHHDIDPDQDRQLNAVLKSLPDLKAPASLQARVMSTIQAKEELPWHRQAWVTWSAVEKSMALGALVVVFGALCFGAYRLSGWMAFQNLKRELVSGFSPVIALWQALGAVLGAIPRVLQTIPTPWLAGCAAAAIVSYFLCMALGTLCFRLAISSKQTT